MLFAVSFEIIIQRAVGNEFCYPMENTLIFYPIGVEKVTFSTVYCDIRVTYCFI
jgi:hypothetical protein